MDTFLRCPGQRRAKKFSSVRVLKWLKVWSHIFKFKPLCERCQKFWIDRWDKVSRLPLTEQRAEFYIKPPVHLICVVEVNHFIHGAASHSDKCVPLECLRWCVIVCEGKWQCGGGKCHCDVKLHRARLIYWWWWGNYVLLTVMVYIQCTTTKLTPLTQSGPPQFSSG